MDTLFSFQTDGMGYIYLVDGQGNVIARDEPTDESDAAHIACMKWLLDQAKWAGQGRAL